MELVKFPVTVRVHEKVQTGVAMLIFMAASARFQCQLFAAERTTTTLFVEQVAQSVVSFHSNTHFLCFPFFEIQLPFFVMRIGTIADSGESNDFGIRCVFQSEIACGTVIPFPLTCKSPVSCIDTVKVLSHNPLGTFVMMPALCPSPEGMKNLRIHIAKNLVGYIESVEVNPSPDYRVESGNQVLLRCGFVLANDTPDFSQEALHG